jgi:peptide/nickel transport system substrate-binding protein
MKGLRSRRGWLAGVVAVALIAAACGGDDDSGDGDVTGGDTTDAPDSTDAPDAPDSTDAPDAPDSTDAPDAPDTTDAPDVPDAMAPVRGGTLSYLLEAESDTWDIPGANCAVSCITVMRAVTDPLTIVNDQGEVEPFLLESIDWSDDFTEFTLQMRDGITFHDGTPADGAAVKRNLDEMKAGVLQGQVLIDMTGNELVDPMTVKVTFAQPFSAFPEAIAERTGYLIAPSFWDNPDRSSALMVGTGAFTMTKWTRDEQTVLTANPDYWRTDANGEQLPYLDEVVFRPVPDVSTRRATMESGDADVNMDSFGENLEFWRNDWVDEGNSSVVPDPARETTYLLINNEVPPFDDPDMRRALALCTDRDEYLAFRAPGNAIANGPFAEGSLGYLEDPGFPGFDADAGNALLDQIGRPAEIVYGTTNVPSNLLTAELFADMWSTNCGLTVNIDQFDQSELITKAITGSFQAFLWRNHGQGNPALENIWWNSRFTTGIALNFGRIREPDLDALLAEAQSTRDTAELDRIAQDISKSFAEHVNNLWLNVTEWENVFQGNVHGVGVLSLPSGNKGQTAIAGRTWVTEAWKEG